MKLLIDKVVNPVVERVTRSVVAKTRGGINWSSYWSTLISATVENTAPTHVVLTFAEGKPELLATDLTCTVNGVARTISSASWTGAVWTAVLASAVQYGDVVVVTFVKSGGTAAVTNNVLTYSLLLTSTGNGTGVTTVRMQTSANMTVTLGTNAKFYSDAAGTLDESATWLITPGALRTIYLKCTTGTATMTFGDASKLIRWGDQYNHGWAGDTNCASVSGTVTALPLISFHMYGNCDLTGAMPDSITILRFQSVSKWTYSGALPNSLTWVLFMAGLLDWTGLSVGNNGNISTLNLNNYRQAKMSSADMVTLLTQMTNRTGTLPATVTINDYADYASPPQAVVDAVAALKLAKNITTVNLGQ